MTNVVDLFAGVGGLSLGAARAGFNVLAAVEQDSHARESHALNFPHTLHMANDIATLSGEELLSSVRPDKDKLDGLIGGPPCQGFSSIGRRCPDDPRNNLFFHFFRLVSETNPRFFVAENVPGIMRRQYDGLRQAAFDVLKDRYLILDPIKAVASEYGAPTSRTRYFFIGVSKSCAHEGVNISSSDFIPCPDISKINVREALRGLPTNICESWISDKDGWREVRMQDINNKSEFFKRVIGMIPPNVGHPPSIERYMKEGVVSGCQGTRHSPKVALRYKNLQIGKIDPISRSARLDPDGFCPTLRAGTGSDRGSYQAVRPIHFEHGRVITPREAARLQGFPDWFRFHETKWHSFRQIGNSVSPLVAEAILTTIYDALFLNHRLSADEKNVAIFN